MSYSALVHARYALDAWKRQDHARYAGIAHKAAGCASELSRTDLGKDVLSVSRKPEANVRPRVNINKKKIN